MKRWPRAFTILEVLIVIAIIVLLAGLAFPTYIQAKKEAGISATLSKLHQQWLAIKMYQEANGGEGNYGEPSSMNLPDPMTFIGPIAWELRNNYGARRAVVTLWKSSSFSTTTIVSRVWIALTL